MLDKNARILVTGSHGMVGSALVQLLKSMSFQNILKPTRDNLDLCDAAQLDSFFEQHRPEYVFMIAAKVGGIAANMADPVGFLSDNVRMSVNLFEACHKFQIKKGLYLGSSCIYPREAPQPMKEEYLMSGPLEPTNEAYAISKIVGLKLAEYYHSQFGMLTVCPMPSNIYGTNDHFDLRRSHVLSALVRRFVDARDSGQTSVTLWGTGVARREFIHVDDVARALMFLMDVCDSPHIVNVGTGTDVSILELANMITDEVEYLGHIEWDTSKPDGMPRKCMDISRLLAMGYEPQVDLRAGIRKTVSEYRMLKKAGGHNE